MGTDKIIPIKKTGKILIKIKHKIDHTKLCYFCGSPGTVYTIQYNGGNYEFHHDCINPADWTDADIAGEIDYRKENGLKVKK